MCEHPVHYRALRRFTLATRAMVLTVFLAGVNGCGGVEEADGVGQQRAAIELTHHERWAPVSRDKDPYALSHPGANTCPHWMEDGLLEIKTGTCSFVTLEQESSVFIKRGAKIRSTLLYDRQTTTDAKGHFELSIGSDLVWELDIQLPQEPGVTHIQFMSPKAYPVGTPIRFHFHNHGANTWRLLPLLLEP